MKKLNRIGAVIPRYGSNIGGGAETLIRSILLELRSVVPKIEVFATTASDHRTWNNDLEAGQSIEDGILVRRFPVDDRNLEVFIGAEQRLHRGEILSVKEQLDWISNSVNSSSMYATLLREASDFDLLLYAPYLFGTSFFGPLLYPDNAVLVPCLHDEVYAYQPIFRSIFRKVKGVMWNAKPEAVLAESIYELPELAEKGRVVGMGFTPITIEEKLPSPHPRSYLLYSGRKETGKNLHYLFECYSAYRRETSDPVDLLLIGSGEIDFVSELPEGVFDLGFVKEEEKAAIFSNAFLFVQPSINESFSIVLMEAWLYGAPALVHGDCAVTSYHAETSGGGLTFRTIHDFKLAVDKISSSIDLRAEMAKKGADYVKSEYAWSAVRDRFLEAANYWIS